MEVLETSKLTNKSFNPMEWWRKWKSSDFDNNEEPSSDFDNNDGLVYKPEEPSTYLPKSHVEKVGPNLGGGKLLKKFRRK